MKPVVEINSASLARVRGLLKKAEGLPPLVIPRAINKALIGVRTDVSSGVRDVIRAKKAAVDAKVVINKANLRDSSGSVVISAKAFSLADFGPKQTNKGVSVKMYVKKPGRVYVGAFLGRSSSAGSPVLRRKKPPGSTGGKANQRYPRGKTSNVPWQKFGDKYRLPVKKLFGPQLLTIVEGSDVMPAVMAKSSIRLETTLNQEINYELSKLT